jgi:hypothetical protein
LLPQITEITLRAPAATNTATFAINFRFIVHPPFIPDNSDWFSQVFNQVWRLLCNLGLHIKKGPTEATPADPFFSKV